MLKNAELIINVPVKNMTRALQFYQKTLGCKINSRSRGALKDVWAEVAANSKTKLWFGPGVWQLTFVVKNIKRDVAALEKKNVKFKRMNTKMGGEMVTKHILKVRSGHIAVFSDSEKNPCMLFQAAPKRASKKRAAQKKKT